jgi:hypothetical protein
MKKDGQPKEGGLTIHRAAKSGIGEYLLIKRYQDQQITFPAPGCSSFLLSAGKIKIVYVYELKNVCKVRFVGKFLRDRLT